MEEHIQQHSPAENIKHALTTQTVTFLSLMAADAVVDVTQNLKGPGFLVGGLIAGIVAYNSPGLASRFREIPAVATLLPEREQVPPTNVNAWDRLIGTSLQQKQMRYAKLHGLPQPVVVDSSPVQEEPTSSPEEPEEEVGAKTTAVLPPEELVDEAKEMEPIVAPSPSFIGSRPEYRLDLADTFQPDANDPLPTGVLALGCQGSGKTTVIVRFMEQYIKRFHLPCVIFDSQGDFKSLVEDGHCPRGVIATPENFPSMEDVVRLGLQVVVDLSEWTEEGMADMSFERAAEVIADSIRGLMRAQKAIAPGKRIPVFSVVDEVHLWVPQSAPSYLTPVTARKILDAVIGLATTGRKLGVVPMFATQRIAKVNKDVIGSVETRIFGKADLDVDLKRYREYIPERVVTDEQIRGFRKGQMVVCFGGQQIPAQFKDRESRHESHNPRVSRSLKTFAQRLPQEALEQIQQVQQSVQQPAPKQVAQSLEKPHPSGELPKVYHRHAGLSAEERRRQRLQRQHTFSVEEPVEKESESPVPSKEEVQRAFPGILPGKRAIMRQFGITDHQAWKIYQDLKQGYQQPVG